ncbi:uncharacterized protein LOC133202407 [Saccostrea echinata]|uniref:uncharacterized protein LOC133202407 n=1 Tax=Saccostrea echinata TaxID=191078 RepID=UPI002A8403DC|nr:uncharacterized protein LOC133202407 [Saccostrea echinata]
MRTVLTKLADQILLSTYRQVFPGWYTLPSRAVTTRYWDGEKFVEMETAPDLSASDEVPKGEKLKEESEKILNKLGEDDPRVKPRASVQGAPRGLKYRKKYVEALKSKEKIEESYSIEKIEKILSEMVIAQQQNQQAERGDGIQDEFSLIKNERPPNPYATKQRKCILCEYDVHLDYKNARLLSQFVSPHTGRIYNRGTTGLCTPMQKHVASLIKTARAFGFMPFLNKRMEFKDDPDIRSKEI